MAAFKKSSCNFEEDQSPDEPVFNQKMIFVKNFEDPFSYLE